MKGFCFEPDDFSRRLAVVAVGVLAVWLLAGCHAVKTEHGYYVSVGTDAAGVKVDLQAGTFEAAVMDQSTAVVQTVKEARNLGLGAIAGSVAKAQSADAAGVDKAAISGETARARSADAVRTVEVQETQRTAREALHAAE